MGRLNNISKLFLLCLVAALIVVANCYAEGFLDCPSGTQQVGSPPPDGREVYCAKVLSDTANTKHGPFVAFFPSGQKRIEGRYDMGEKDGVFTTYYKTGAISRKEGYARGQRHGKFVWYFPNGTRRLSEEYNMGSRQGARQGWYKNGEPALQTQYLAGHQTGPVQYWYKTGGKRITGMLDRNSRKTGPWVMYSKTGDKTAEGSYRDGKKEGVWRFWYADGALKSVVRFVDGRAVSKVKKDKKKGKKDKRSKGKDKIKQPRKTVHRIGSDDEDLSSDRNLDKARKKIEREVEDEEVDEESEEQPSPAVSETPINRQSYREALDSWKKERGLSAVPSPTTEGDD